MNDDLIQRLESLRDAFEELIRDGMEFSEVVEVLVALKHVIMANGFDGSCQSTLSFAWLWADGRFGIIDKMNKRIDLPILNEQTEAKLFRAIIQKFVIPVVCRGFGGKVEEKFRNFVK